MKILYTIFRVLWGLVLRHFYNVSNKRVIASIKNWNKTPWHILKLIQCFVCENISIKFLKVFKARELKFSKIAYTLALQGLQTIF